MAAVEGGVEAGDLRHARKGRPRRLDAAEIMRLVQRRERNERGKRLQNIVVDDDRRA